jgi:AcrR family transcriptional regulator
LRVKRNNIPVGMETKRKQSPEPGHVRGRPRLFDTDAALNKALRVFWKKGYEGTSLPDLTAAMGINRPSLYAAFGNKEELFRKAVARYVQDAAAMMQDALDQPTARGTVETLLRWAIGKPSKSNPRGCLLVHGALACSDSSDRIRCELSQIRNANEILLRQRFERAVSEGDLSKNANPAALAKFVATFQQGLAVQASGGASCEELSAAVDVLLARWPK